MSARSRSARPRKARPPAIPRGGRVRGQTSRAIAASSRTNGAKGGRPRARLPEDRIHELGPEPDDPLKVPKWHRKLTGILIEGLVTGRDWKELAKTVQSLQKTTNLTLKLELACDAILERIADDDVRDDDAAPASIAREEDRIAGANAGALRRDPS